ncbi:MAG: hypothetical protein WCH85_08805 [Methanomicrobiales archaeon]
MLASFHVLRLAGIPGIDSRVGESLVGKDVVFEELLCGFFGEAAIDYAVLRDGGVTSVRVFLRQRYSGFWGPRGLSIR